MIHSVQLYGLCFFSFNIKVTVNSFTSYLYYNIIFFIGIPWPRMYNSHINFTNASTTPLLFYYPQNSLFFYLPQNNFLTALPLSPFAPNSATNPPPSIQTTPSFQKEDQILKEKASTCESLQQLQESPKTVRCRATPSPASYSKYFRGKPREVRLDYRVEWKNQNRNIVPNILNQVLSYLLKPSKSGAMLRLLFSRLPHVPQCSPGKFYQYAKKIRDSITHFVNQAIFLRFLQIHEPNCELYSLQEQLFYMRICRTLVLSFLRNEVRLISLTSKRMSHAKRKIHLIAREALASKFLEVCRNFRD